MYHYIKSALFMYYIGGYIVLPIVQLTVLCIVPKVTKKIIKNISNDYELV